MKEIKYVVSNPPKDLKLKENDLVFVLSQSDPGDPEKWEDFKFFDEFEDFDEKKKQK